MGKGSKPRPFSDRAEYEKNFGKVFQCHHKWHLLRGHPTTWKCIKCSDETDDPYRKEQP